MTTRLDGPLKREFEIAGAPYTLTITAEGMTLAPKGRRKGFELQWRALVSGDAAIAAALNASLAAKLTPSSESRKTTAAHVERGKSNTGTRRSR
jgi:hypothetical protein